MRAVSSGTGGTGCDRRSDMDNLRTRDPSNTIALHKAADFANGVRTATQHSNCVLINKGLPCAKPCCRCAFIGNRQVQPERLNHRRNQLVLLSRYGRDPPALAAVQLPMSGYSLRA